MDRFEKYNKGDILKVACGEVEFIFRYVRVTGTGLVVRNGAYGVWKEKSIYRSGYEVLCRLENVTDVRIATDKEKELLLSYITD